MPHIHPTALVDPSAHLHPSVEVGPFCVVGPHVALGEGTRLLSHVVVQNHTTLGAHNTVHPFAVLGGAPQDLKFKGEPARVVIGDHNVFRESVTVNIGTAGAHMQTTVGNHCLLMAYAHVAHDCTVGNHVVIANGVALAGHVDIHDHVILGGLAAIHQFVRIGKHAFIGGGAMVGQDIPPYCMAVGDRAKLAGINLIGLQRAGWSRQEIKQMHALYKALFTSETPRQQAWEEVRSSWDLTPPHLALLWDFIQTASRGVASARQTEHGS